MVADTPIFVELRGGGDDTHAYRVGGSLVIGNRAVEELEPFRAGDEDARGRVPTGQAPSGPPPSAPLLYADRGWVGGHYAMVECRRSEEGFWLDVEGAGEFLVMAEGDRILQLQGSRVRANVRPVDAVLGPCLCLALALRGTFCLHAAAAAGTSSRERLGAHPVIALAGLSGAGKSTLAAALAGRPRGGETWCRLGDDILPVAQAPPGAVALPHFPQLKLPASSQWGRDSAGELALTTLFRLTATAQGDAVQVRRLGGRAAAVAIIRHTVAGRLFDAGLASQHLEFAGRLAGEIPVYDLTVPRGLGTLPEVLAAIESVL